MENSVFAHNLKCYRTLKGLTQEGLADALSISTQAVSKWEQGKCYPETQMLPELSELLNISIDELFGNKIEKEIVFQLDGEAPWSDDNKLRIVLYSGRKIMHQSTFDCEEGTHKVSFSCLDKEFDISGLCTYKCDSEGPKKRREKYLK